MELYGNKKGMTYTQFLRTNVLLSVDFPVIPSYSEYKYYAEAGEAPRRIGIDAFLGGAFFIAPFNLVRIGDVCNG
ncbi:hypothetical protein D3C73_1024950 [compost metagenome]